MNDLPGGDRKTAGRGKENASPDNPARSVPSPVDKLSRLADPVTKLPGVGSTYARRLAQLGIKTVGHLLYHFPRRYLDRSNVTPIGSVKIGQDVTVIGTVCDVNSRRTRSRKNILVVTLFDGTGYMSGVWFNQEYHRDRLREGVEVAFSGKVQFQYKRLQMVNPSYDVLGGGEEGEDQGGGPQGIHTGRIIPLYPGTAGITSAVLRKMVSGALDAVDGMADVLPEEVRRTFGLMTLTEALREVHFPEGEETLKKARYRALFDEVFIMQVGLALRKKRREREGGGISHGSPGGLVERFRLSLPFELTAAQEKAWGEIAGDMSRAIPMNRLLQGDVGSGKTVVAVQALLLAAEGGYQGAIMAPTEVLAHQHYRRIGEMLEGLPVRVGLITAGTPVEDLRDLASGDVDVVVGTHALIQEGVSFDRLGVVVIDEQQRFGLRQRVTLAAKGSAPDILHMSATPIPRTLSLTLYGDLDVSVIEELPAGRKGVVTVVADNSQRKGAYAMVGKEVRLGRQAFVICPLVEESDKLEIRAAEKE
ncbi:MAG: ATP-dependent DNA helicase RecG, partial [Actinobacteria bacterium]|nr:ATP-dependent DNA helicase RecG [Actinomycetota bacterium]